MTPTTFVAVPFRPARNAHLLRLLGEQFAVQNAEIQGEEFFAVEIDEEEDVSIADEDNLLVGVAGTPQEEDYLAPLFGSQRSKSLGGVILTWHAPRGPHSRSLSSLPRDGRLWQIARVATIELSVRANVTPSTVPILRFLSASASHAGFVNLRVHNPFDVRAEDEDSYDLIVASDEWELGRRPSHDSDVASLDLFRRKVELTAFLRFIELKFRAEPGEIGHLPEFRALTDAVRRQERAAQDVSSAAEATSRYIADPHAVTGDNPLVAVAAEVVSHVARLAKVSPGEFLEAVRRRQASGLASDPTVAHDLPEPALPAPEEEETPRTPPTPPATRATRR